MLAPMWHVRQRHVHKIGGLPVGGQRFGVEVVCRDVGSTDTDTTWILTVNETRR